MSCRLPAHCQLDAWPVWIVTSYIYMCDLHPGLRITGGYKHQIYRPSESVECQIDAINIWLISAASFTNKVYLI